MCTCICNYLQHLDNNPNCETVAAFSDATCSQNRNYTVASMLLYFVQRSRHIKQVNLIFFESGHSQNEGDSIHASIERNSRHISVYTPQHWVGIIRTANKQKPLHVYELSEDDFKDWKEVKGHIFPTKLFFADADEQLLISKIKWLRVSKPGLLEATDDTFNAVNLRAIRTHRYRPTIAPKIKKRYGGISKEKKDLWNLCQQNVIPAIHHQFFQQLIENPSVIDSIEGIRD